MVSQHTMGIYFLKKKCLVAGKFGFVQPLSKNPMLIVWGSFSVTWSTPEISAVAVVEIQPYHVRSL